MVPRQFKTVQQQWSFMKNMKTVNEGEVLLELQYSIGINLSYKGHYYTLQNVLTLQAI